MKIAVIYSGEPRTFERVVNQHTSEFLKGLDYDTYHSTWTKTSDDEIEIIKLAPNLQNIELVDYGCSERPDIRHFEHVLLNNKINHPIFMLGRIQYMTGMAFEHIHDVGQDYDYVVRLRYDFEYEGHLTDYLPLVKNMNDIVVTRKMGGKSSPLNIWDGFALGTQTSMTWYFYFHRWIPFSLFNKDIAEWKFQPEFVYGLYLRHACLNVVESDVQPIHIYPENHDIDWHRQMRTVQYYRDLATFHPDFYVQRDGKLLIENDSPTVTDKFIIDALNEEGIQCNEV